MKKKFFILVAMLALLVSVVGCGLNKDKAEREVYDVYLAADNGKDTVTFKYLQYLGERLEKASNGRIKAHYYSDAQVGGDIELLESIQNGNITFVAQNSAPQVNFVPQAAVFDIPMAFPNEKIARKVLVQGSPVFEALKKYYADKNIVLLGIADQSFRQLSTNKEIKSIEDLKGLKIRTMENRYHLKFWSGVGANPTPMSFSEVYMGLQQGVIDGQENPFETLVANRFYEQQKYVVTTNHIYHTVVLVGSPKIINRLPKDLQQVVYDVSKEATAWAGTQTDERAAGRAKIVTDYGSVIVPFNEQLFEQMKATRGPTIELIKSRIGKDLPDLLITEVDKAVAENAATGGL